MGLRKKLQVFVSSTFIDLVKERQAAVEAILAAGHIPAGMELFSAGDKSQLEVIKRWIDESDVYLLLLGGRYGSIDPDTGKSYTQLEYEYAVGNDKPFFSLVITEEHLDEKVRAIGKEVLELDFPQKLVEFRKIVKGRLVQFWSDPRDIKLSVLQTLAEFERRPDLIGWVPGNEALNSNMIAAGIARLAGYGAHAVPRESFNISINRALEKLEKKQFKHGLVGVPSGFADLDRLTSGWQRGELTVLASKPAIGKTAFVLSFLLNAGVNFNIPVAVFTLESSTEQVVERLISSYIELNIEDVRRGTVTGNDWLNLHSGVQKLRNAAIQIDDTPALSIHDLISKCRALTLKDDIQLVVVDYLQLLTVLDNRELSIDQQMELITKSLKILAKELDIPIIAVYQLNHSFEIRSREGRPGFLELKKMAGIEEYADKVCFLYRPEFYGITEDEEGDSCLGLLEVIFVKNRTGHTGTVPLRFIGQYMKVVDWKNPMADRLD